MMDIFESATNREMMTFSGRVLPQSIRYSGPRSVAMVSKKRLKLLVHGVFITKVHHAVLKKKPLGAY
jgi:hypothetical protein